MATIDKLVLLETMADCWREAHRTAGNWGTYPMNGSERKFVSRKEAEEIVANDKDRYAWIVRSARTGDIVDEVSARSYGDHDDCFAAAVADVARDWDLESWQLQADWDHDEVRESIVVRVA